MRRRDRKLFFQAKRFTAAMMLAEGKPPSEIAAELGVSASLVRKQKGKVTAPMTGPVAENVKQIAKKGFTNA